MQGETILSIETRAWDSLWRDGQHIMSRISVQNRVLYFEPGRNPERSMGSELRRNLTHAVSLRPRKVSDNLILIPTPSSLPYGRRHLPRRVLRVATPLVAKVNGQVLLRQVRWAMREFNVKSPILWLYEPRHIDLVGKLGEKLVCYFNYDEMAEFPGNENMQGLLRDYDRRLCEVADVVFATSRGQWQTRKVINPNTYMVPNGVDFDVFNRALANPPLPADIARLPRPIIGFVGWLGWHIDLELLQRVAKAYPHCSLVLVGPDYLPNAEGRKRLQAAPNVFFLGQKDRHELPNYLQAFDVALMPYGLSEHLRASYPLKLHEYLAAGRPIVATGLPELEPFSDLVRIAESHDQFVQHVGVAMHDHDPQTVAARVAVARQNTWDDRVVEIYRILERHLGGVNKGEYCDDSLHCLGALQSTS